MKRCNKVYRVGRFPQLTRRVFTTEQGLKSNTAAAMCFDMDGNLYVGTDKGISRRDGDRFVPFDIGLKDPKISMLYCTKDNHLFVGVDDRLYEFKGKKKLSMRTYSSKPVDMIVDGDNVTWVLTETVLYRYPEGEKEFDMQIGVPGKGTCIAALRNNKVYIGTENDGVHALTGKRWHWCELRNEFTGLPSNKVSCVYLDPVGNVWIGTDKGVCVYDDNSLWVDKNDVFLLPDANITGMAVADDGDKYFATATGLIHQHNGKLTYYGYKRWLPSPHATGVVIAPDGTVCVSTDAGISVFETTMMTLEEKAKYLRAQTERLNIRKDGYVLYRQLDREGVLDTDEGWITNSDNDGMWTALYVGALSFEYACTRDEQVRADALRSLKAMIKLTKITGIEGFTARAIRYPDERDYGTGARHEWHDAVDEDGNKLEWLGETSSDEMVGHFYAYSMFYDYVANDEEKELIRGVVRKILNHILDNNFHLIDTDGVPTTWANWNPDLLNDDHKWIFEKGTNSLQILTFLKIGEHMLGEKRYTDTFNYLANNRHYAMNLMYYRIFDGHMLHIDDNHDFLMIYLLMKYTDDPQLRAIFSMGLTNHWNDERVERNAYFNSVYGAVTGEHCDIENVVDELMDFPMDPVMWSLYNSYRPDLKWDMAPVEMGMTPQLFEPLEAHERRIIYADCNRFTADSGAEDVAEPIFKASDDPTAFTMFPSTGDDKGMEAAPATMFLQPYWFARLHGLIEDAE